MANAGKLRETLAVLKEHLNRWDQTIVVEGAVNPNAQDWTEYGTTFCFAGLRCLMDGLRPEYERWDGEYVATGNFIDPESGNSINGLRYARNVFELKPFEADTIFVYLTDDIDKFEERIENVIAGNYR